MIVFGQGDKIINSEIQSCVICPITHRKLWVLKQNIADTLKVLGGVTPYESNLETKI